MKHNWQPSDLKLIQGPNIWALYPPWITGLPEAPPLLSGPGQCSDLDRRKAMNILEMHDKGTIQREGKMNWTLSGYREMGMDTDRATAALRESDYTTARNELFNRHEIELIDIDDFQTLMEWADGERAAGCGLRAAVLQYYAFLWD